MKALLFLALAACNPYLTAETVAPPGRAARLDEVTGFFGVTKSYRLEVTQGVALAFTCSYGGPCEHMTAVSDNPAIAEVRPASLASLRVSGLTSTATASASVVVGKTVGTTRVHVHSKEGDRDIAVTVVAPPHIVGT